ncbi:DUF192 domain-containing protein [Amaricoccus tamworthensis]|uniref:DUF192 domain-containing protein n=1 Tax=Amaricoccus tamworthensis TaxID=57002 RepID=UPI003C7B02C2
MPRIFGSSLTLALFLPAFALAAECQDDALDIRLGESTYRFDVEVMDDRAERARGMMHRESLGRFAGMLFVYDYPQPVSFWMRNTLIPLDMLFFDETGALVSFHENAVPLDETPIPGGNRIQYVLEINGGMTSTLGIDEGAELRHPSIDQERAAWPCD